MSHYKELIDRWEDVRRDGSIWRGMYDMEKLMIGVSRCRQVIEEMHGASDWASDERAYFYGKKIEMQNVEDGLEKIIQTLMVLDFPTILDENRVSPKKEKKDEA